MQEHQQPSPPGAPDLPPVGWREVLTREQLPRLLVLCLAIWLHAANTMLAATTMPEAVGDIGGVRLISWAFALYLMGSIVAATAVSGYVASAGPAPYHAGLDRGLHRRMRDLRRSADDASSARGTHGAGARRWCARRAGLHRPGSLLPESARAADRRVPFAGVDGCGAVRAAHRRRVRHRRPVALRLLVVRVAGRGARGGVASAARPSGTRSGLAGATHPGRAAGVRRRSDPRDLVRGRGRLDSRFRRAPAGGMHMPVVVRRARFRRLPPLKAASRPCDRSRPSGRLRHCDDVHTLPVHDVVH